MHCKQGRAAPFLVLLRPPTATDFQQRGPATLRRENKPCEPARAEERKRLRLSEHTIQSLQALANRLGFWPKLVFDRGFGGRSILTHLASKGAVFYVRLKASRLVELLGSGTSARLSVKDLKQKDATVQLYGMTLRVIRSPKSRRAKEPWYILTSDVSSSWNKVVKIYYHRFEIEETFKDVKHIFEFRRTRLNKPLSLKLLLWFVSLGIALLYRATRPTKRQVHQAHSKKQISWLRQAYEELQSAYGRLLWGG